MSTEPMRSRTGRAGDEVTEFHLTIYDVLEPGRVSEYLRDASRLDTGRSQPRT